MAGEGRLGYSLFYNKNLSKKERLRRPLVFIISGLGGSHLFGTSAFLAGVLAEKGLNVVTISSPFQRVFTALGSTTGTPGLTPQDAKDLYSIMKKSLAYLEIVKGYRPITISLAGFSLGALEAAYVAKLDTERKDFDFQRVVMINPPINLDSSTKKIDDMGLLFKLLGPKKQKRLTRKLYNLAFTYADISKEKALGDEFFLNLDKVSPFSPLEIKAIIGANFINTLSGSLFYSELINNFGLFNHNMGNSPAAALRATQRFSYESYYTDILFKRKKNRRPDLTLKIMNEENSISYISKYIKNSDRFYLMHNLDDVILSSKELEYMRTLIPEEKQFIYPLGGHLGNIWFPHNKSDFVSIFN